jgi:putative DNA primase/helicase
MANLFDRANKIGLGCINSWLPNGRFICENEWKAELIESGETIIINTLSGKWINTESKSVGPNTISLYSYLNKIKDQLESAKSILEKYDPEYFPSDDDFYEDPGPEPDGIAFLSDEELQKEKRKLFLDDDDAIPFKVLGKGLDRKVYFHCFRSKEVIGINAHNLKSNYLLEVAPKRWWEKYYLNQNGGIAWQLAQDDMLRRSEIMETFDTNRIRRSGAWIDNGDIVFHAGEYLLINNDKWELTERNGKYIYEKSRFLPIDIDNALTTEQCHDVMELFLNLEMKTEVQKYILAGWCFLAPFGGALKWRPHIWLTGPAGSGKSWVEDNIVDKLVGSEFGIKGAGTSTPAGIRQNLKSTTLGVVLDEMESDNKKHADSIEQILKMFREASSGIESAASTLHGSIDQAGKSWLIRSMACFASIGASLRQDADIDRFTVLNMTTMNLPIEKRKEKFTKLERLQTTLTLEYCRAFVARSYKLIKTTFDCIDVMIEQATDILSSRRHGDQIGTLLAGAWMIAHDKAATAREAKEWLDLLAIDRIHSVSDDRSTEQKAIEQILSHEIRVTDGHVTTMQTIGSCLMYIYRSQDTLVNDEENMNTFPGATPKSVRQSLEKYGIKPSCRNGNWIQLAIKHPSLQRILERTPYANVYEEFILRLPFCDSQLYGPGLFSGIRKRYLRIDADKLFDEVPF